MGYKNLSFASDAVIICQKSEKGQNAAAQAELQRQHGSSNQLTPV